MQICNWSEHTPPSRPPPKQKKKLQLCSKRTIIPVRLFAIQKKTRKDINYEDRYLHGDMIKQKRNDQRGS